MRNRIALIAILLLTSIATFAQTAQVKVAAKACGCSHIIPINGATWDIDGRTYKSIDGIVGIAPGSKVCFESGSRTNALWIHNIAGTGEKPVLITNMCDGVVSIKVAITASGVIGIDRSSFFTLSGSGNANVLRGITLTGGDMSLNVKDLSTDFTINNLVIDKPGYAGIVAKTDPTCDPATWRENFTMKNVKILYNDVTTGAGEGLYIGNSHYETTVSKTCSGVSKKIFEHAIVGLEVTGNIVHDTGSDGIQVGGAISNALITDNVVTNFGTKNSSGQRSGIQINPGSVVICTGNFISKGTGFGIFAGGAGDSYIANNYIEYADEGGMLITQDVCPGGCPYPLNPFTIDQNVMLNNRGAAFYVFCPGTAARNVITSDLPTYQYTRLNNSTVKWTETGTTKYFGVLIRK